MKKGIIILIICIIFLIGLRVGGNYSKGSSNYFEEALDEFEEQITQPGNDYKPKNTKPEPGLTNKIASTIDKLIQKVKGFIISE